MVFGGNFFFENVKSDNLNNFQYVTYTHPTPLVFIYSTCTHFALWIIPVIHIPYDWNIFGLGILTLNIESESLFPHLKSQFISSFLFAKNSTHRITVVLPGPISWGGIMENVESPNRLGWSTLGGGPVVPKLLCPDNRT